MTWILHIVKIYSICNVKWHTAEDWFDEKFWVSWSQHKFICARHRNVQREPPLLCKWPPKILSEIISRSESNQFHFHSSLIQISLILFLLHSLYPDPSPSQYYENFSLRFFPKLYQPILILAAQNRWPGFDLLAL